MNRTRAITGLLADDRGRCRPARAAVASARRLHRDRRGNIAIIFLVLSLVFYGMVATVWNTGQTVSAKVRAQKGADAAAYSAAMWTSRAMNNVTAANMLILRSASAKIATTAVGVTVPWVLGNWIYAVATTPYPANIVLAIWIVVGELPPYGVFVGQAVPAAARYALNDAIDQLYALQQDWVAGLPAVIDEQVARLEDYYGCEITLTRASGSNAIRPPMEPGSHLSLFPLFLLARYFRSDNNWPDVGWLDLSWDEQSKTDKDKKEDDGQQQSDPDEQKPPPKKKPKPKKKKINLSLFDMIFFGKASQGWLAGSLAGYGVVVAAAGNKHHLMSTNPLDYSIVATCRCKVPNDRLLAPGLFRDAISPDGHVTAYAQAETHNGVKGIFDKTIGAVAPPFVSDTATQMLIGWSTWGMQWQPRLNHGDHVWNALQNANAENDAFSGVDVNPVEKDIDAISFH